MRNQKGFGLVEGLLFLILLSILSFTGYYVYHSRNNANSTYNKTANTNLSAQTQSNISKNDFKADEKLVKDFYSAYIQASKNNEIAQSQQPSKDVVAKYGTPKFIAYYSQPRAFDPVFCAQNMPDLGVDIAESITNTTGGENVYVTQKYSGGNSLKSSATVVGGKIDSITCPSP
jgi:hypothetical protein